MEVEFRCFVGSSDMSIWMIFRCLIFVYFPDVFCDFGVSGRLWKGDNLIPAGLLKIKSTVRIRHVQGVFLEARQGEKT